MRKFFAGLTGLLLLPCAAGLGMALYQSLVNVYMETETSHILNLFFVGAATWVIIFFMFPRPVKSYILAHECSHLLAAWFSGVYGGRLRVGADGGSVEVAKSTVWIALAPYLIPFYSLLLIALHYLASLWWDPALWVRGMPFALGFTWSYHLCFTLYILAIPQSDVQPYGRLGAFSLILSGNLFLLCLALLLMNDQPMKQDLHLILQQQQISYQYSWSQLRTFFSSLKNAIIQS